MPEAEILYTHIDVENDEIFDCETDKKEILQEDTSEKQEISGTDIPETELQYIAKPTYDLFKRILDVTLCSIAVLVLVLPLLIIMLVIEIDDPKGTPIFSQTRCGKNGKPFKIYKFRTMCSDAEEKIAEYQKYNEMDGPVFKMKNDPRITRAGKILRSTGLDELPQLLNIIKGDMSLVGPRPALPSEVEQYSESSRVRLKVLPGLTCYWQILPERNTVSFEKWMELDRKYVAERSFWVDIKIIFKTFFTVIKMQGC